MMDTHKISSWDFLGGDKINNYRLVLLDYAKHQLDKPLVQKVLGDIIISKQKNYERTDPNYIVLDQHDMIGTHALIYETTNLFEPRLISAMRITYEIRTQLHKIKTPIQNIIPHFDIRGQQEYLALQKQYPVFAECGSWFIDPNFSYKSSGLRFSDIIYTMVFLQVTRLGINHIVGCTNEKYKAHRRLENIGTFKKGYEFLHPIISDPHMLVFIEKFNIAYIGSVYESYKDLFDNLLEITPQEETYKSIAETIQDEFVNPWAHKIAS